MRRGTRRHPAGFTLVEIVVTLVILAITAAVTVPAFAALGRPDDASRPAEPLLAILRSARRAAIERAVEVAVTVDSATGRYWAAEVDADDVRPLAEGRLALPDGAELSTRSARARWMFTPTGAATGDTVAVRAAGGATVRVAVDPWTGEPDADSP